MRKRLLICLLITTMLLLTLAAPAFARNGSYWQYSATSSSRIDAAINGFASSSATNYYGNKIAFLTAPATIGGVTTVLMDVPNQNPHAGYATTGAKCKVCHAVHGAGLSDGTNVTTERLLRSTVADACTFCHVTTNFATTVYGGQVADYIGGTAALPGALSNYSRENGSGHTAGHRTVATETPAAYAGCASCHSVHGAATIAGGTNILKNDPAKGVTSNLAVAGGWGSFVAPVTNQRDFCLDCHDGTKRTAADGTVTPIVAQADLTAVFKNCGTSGCHNSVATDWLSSSHRTQLGVSAPAGRNGRSHVMTTDLANPTGQLAWTATAVATEGAVKTENSCATCHTAGGFPHYAVGVGDLITGYTTDTAIDGVCLSCHVNPSDSTQGVGRTY
ncbi:MAG: hypothetical protein KKA32_17210 [Actinobacteria bacterium]|nr:hypothetical protein [Actinomycetota bacterium]